MSIPVRLAPDAREIQRKSGEDSVAGNLRGVRSHVYVAIAPNQAKIRYRGTSYNDGNLLRPSQVVEMFDRVIAGIDPLAEDTVSAFSLVHVHWEALLLGD